MCATINGEQGTWRTNTGLKGGGKGWCKKCLKKEENLLKDASGHASYVCRTCQPAEKTRLRRGRKGYEECQKLNLCL